MHRSFPLFKLNELFSARSHTTDEVRLLSPLSHYTVTVYHHEVRWAKALSIWVMSQVMHFITIGTLFSAPPPTHTDDQLQLPPTPPSSHGSDSDGSQSPHSMPPSSPARLQARSSAAISSSPLLTAPHVSTEAVPLATPPSSVPFVFW